MVGHAPAPFLFASPGSCWRLRGSLSPAFHRRFRYVTLEQSKRDRGGDESDAGGEEEPTVVGGAGDGAIVPADKRARTLPSTALVAVDASTALIAAATMPVRAGWTTTHVLAAAAVAGGWGNPSP